MYVRMYIIEVNMYVNNIHIIPIVLNYYHSTRIMLIYVRTYILRNELNSECVHVISSQMLKPFNCHLHTTGYNMAGSYFDCWLITDWVGVW